MIQKIKNIGLILLIIVVLGFICFSFYKLWRSERERAERWEENFKQQTQKIQELNLTWKEYKKVTDDRTDSILKELKVRPKWVREVNYINHYYYDSTTVVINPDPVVQPSGTVYPFIDKNECFTIGGHMKVDPLDLTPELTINLREYTDETTQIFYKKRRKLLGFIPWTFENYQEVSSTCGTNEVKRINIIKRGK